MYTIRMTKTFRRDTERCRKHGYDMDCNGPNIPVDTGGCSTPHRRLLGVSQYSFYPPRSYAATPHAGAS